MIVHLSIKNLYRKRLVLIQFEYHHQLHNCVKRLTDVEWNSALKAWCLPYTPDCIGDIRQAFQSLKQVTIDDTEIAKEEKRDIVLMSIKKEISVEQQSYIHAQVEKFVRWLRSRRYSESTIKSYQNAIKVFLFFHGEKAIEDIGNEDLIAFNNDYIIANCYSASIQNQTVNAVKLFFKVIEETRMDVDLIHRPKRARVLPNVLSKAEVKSILNALINSKHKAMLSLIYSCGLRCGELLSLKPSNINSDRMILQIYQAKGKKDRIAPLSQKTIDMLREYFKLYRPKVFLFEGAIKGEPYDARSLQNVMKRAVRIAGINKPVTLHWLRHSYATHLLESGTDLRYIQEILGHRSSRTTEIYTHVSTSSIQQIISPFDTL